MVVLWFPMGMETHTIYRPIICMRLIRSYDLYVLLQIALSVYLLASYLEYSRKGMEYKESHNI